MMSEKELRQLSFTEADTLINEATRYLEEFMAYFNATHDDPDAHEIDFRPGLMSRKGEIPVDTLRPYFEQLCALTLAQEYVILPGQGERSNEAPLSRPSEMEVY